MIERRKHIRREFIYKVIYSPTENPKRRFKARSFNISLGGIGLTLRNFIEGSERLTLFIFNPYRREPVEAKGKLIWQNRFHDITERRAGIQFTEIPWSEIKMLLGENVTLV